MTLAFSTSEFLRPLANYPITKGDKPGHIFRGNQYRQMTGDIAGQMPTW